MNMNTRTKWRLICMLPWVLRRYVLRRVYTHHCVVQPVMESIAKQLRCNVHDIEKRVKALI